MFQVIDKIVQSWNGSTQQESERFLKPTHEESIKTNDNESESDDFLLPLRSKPQKLNLRMRLLQRLVPPIVGNARNTECVLYEIAEKNEYMQHAKYYPSPDRNVICTLKTFKEVECDALNRTFNAIFQKYIEAAVERDEEFIFKWVEQISDYCIGLKDAKRENEARRTSIEFIGNSMFRDNNLILLEVTFDNQTMTRDFERIDKDEQKVRVLPLVFDFKKGVVVREHESARLRTYKSFV